MPTLETDWVKLVIHLKGGTLVVLHGRGEDKARFYEAAQVMLADSPQVVVLVGYKKLPTIEEKVIRVRCSDVSCVELEDDPQVVCAIKADLNYVAANGLEPERE